MSSKKQNKEEEVFKKSKRFSLGKNYLILYFFLEPSDKDDIKSTTNSSKSSSKPRNDLKRSHPASIGTSSEDSGSSSSSSSSESSSEDEKITKKNSKSSEKSNNHVHVPLEPEIKRTKTEKSNDFDHTPHLNPFTNRPYSP